MTILNFNAANVPPDEGRGDPIPPGWYVAALEKAEVKPTKDGVNKMLACVFGVLDGQFKGRKVYFNFNMWHSNAQTVEIAYKQFSAVCHAVNHLQVGDVSELYTKPMKINVSVRPADGQYAASNDIKAFKNVNDPSAGGAGAQAVAATPPTFPPPQTQQAWQPPPAVQPQQQWAPPVQPAAQPPAQWQPPATAQPPAQPASAQPPAWQPPPGAQPQPWAQPQAPVQAPAAPVQPPPPAGPPAWAPPAAQPGAGVQPPWMTQPPAAPQ